MAEIDYRCTRCGKPEKRELLTVKKVIFQGIGVNPQISKTRTAGWLCPVCVARDAEWNLEPFEAPGPRSRQKEEFDAAAG
jgi:hypothetical protein